MFKNKVLYLLAILVVIMASGCGGGSGSGDSVSGDSVSSGSTSSASENTASVDVTLKVVSVECLNASNLEAGREIRLKSTVNSLKNSDQNITMLYRIFKNGDDNATGSFFASDTFVPAQGDNSRNINAMLPASIQSGNYRVEAIVENEYLGSKNFNLSALDEALYAKTSTLYIQANDGKPDIETTSFEVAATDSANLANRAVSNTTTLLTLDFGVVDGNVILNSRAVAFTGVLGVQNYIAKSKAFKVSACINIAGSCKAIEIYSVDDSNQTHYNSYQTVSPMEANHFKYVVFNGLIREDLLNEVATKLIKNSNFTTTIKAVVGGINESATQDVQKNSITTSVKFAPIFLSSSNIDNTYDRVALALSNYKLSMKTYIDDIKKIDPTYNVEVNSGGLDLFNPNLNWQINDPIADITLQKNDANIYTDKPIVFKPITGSNNIQMIEPEKIPYPVGVNKQNDPIYKIEPVDDYISQLSIGTKSSPLLQGTINKSDLATETVSSKIFKAEYDIPLFTGNSFALKATMSGQAKFNFNGAYFSGGASGNIYIIKKWYEIISVEAASQTVPTNLEHTGYHFGFDFLGKNVYEQHKYVTEEQGVSTSHAKTMRKRVQENIATLKNINGDILSYHDNIGWADGVSDEYHFMAGPVPISYGYSAIGKTGVVLKLDIKSIGRIDAVATPYAEFTAEGWIAAGLTYHGFGIATGVRGTLDIINERFPMGGSAGIKFIEGDDGIDSYIGELSEFITNEYTAPWGCFKFFADYILGEYTKKIWCSDKNTDISILLMKHQTLFKVNLL